MIPAIKTYNIDYEFIINNYTDIKLWDKRWTLFVFKNYVFTLMLASIDVRRKEITFELSLSSDLDIWSRNQSILFYYNIKNMNLKMLKHLIYTSMKSLVRTLEINYIWEKDIGYKLIESGSEEEDKRLREIAEDFLNDNNISNDEIREVYIDYYIDNNRTVNTQLTNYQESMIYTYLTDLYLILAEINQDNYLKDAVMQNQRKDLSNIVKEVENFMEYLNSDDYREEMEEKLEGI